MPRSAPAAFVALLLALTCLVTSGPSQAARSAKRPPAPTATPAVPLQGTTVTLRAKFPTKFRRPATLQINTGAGWRNVQTKKTQRNGRVAFAVTVPGNVLYRVRAKKVRHHGVKKLLITQARRVPAKPRAELVTGTPAGKSTGKEGGSVELSADARYVVFMSAATNLVQGVTGYTENNSHIYLRDRVARTTVLVDGASASVAGNGTSSHPGISRDGRYVTFASLADNLVDWDSNDKQDIFRWDRTNGTIIRVTSDAFGDPTDNSSYDPVISANGSRIAYSTDATTIDSDDDNGVSDVYVWDSGTGKSERVSEDVLGNDSNGASYAPSISADGAYVGYQSNASDLVIGDSNGTADVYRRNIAAGTNARVSVATSGQPNGYSTQAAVSATGRYVAFASQADNLVAGGSPDNGSTNVFVRDMTAGTTVLASRDRVSGPTNGMSYGATSISDDGRLVTFPSMATDLVAGDTNGKPDGFLWDRSTGKVSMIVRDKLWGPTNGPIFEPVLSADTKWVGFYTQASDLSPSDTSPVTDGFVWRR
ncbi:TolB family protein [Nocardioides marmoriginsengisoli]|uniref:TolB family protein n=1 Tax=Nocardioides marmoriginsengisoli TaxID=661483 RepID=UPI00160F538D|nr:PD40 domain-containing protein [Nocardioides marmoriginsengisoli]